MSICMKQTKFKPHKESDSLPEVITASNYREIPKLSTLNPSNPPFELPQNSTTLFVSRSNAILLQIAQACV